MINATEIRKGMVIRFEDEPYLVLEFEHIAPGNWRAMVQVKMKNLKTGRLREYRFRSDDKVEVVYMESIEMEYLYNEGENFIFMNLSNYDQISLSKEIVGSAAGFLKPNLRVSINYYDREPINVELPIRVDLEVVETEPSIKGATATSTYKPAILETGLSISVPPFIEKGDIVRVDTRDGKYLERVK